MNFPGRHTPMQAAHVSGTHYSDPPSPLLYNHQHSSNFQPPSNRPQEKIQVLQDRTSMTPEPICSKRLLPTRHQTKNAVLSILPDGEVCLEFVKKKGILKKDTVCEVMKISSDGLRIVMYEPNGGSGVPLADEPPPMPIQGADKIYGLENLPEKQRKKYQYAAKFVDLVRAKTPKVTYYTDKAKCFLMENLTDFEVCFYDSGKITQTATEGITIVDTTSKKYTFRSSLECNSLTGHLELMWSHFKDALNHCHLLERTLSNLPKPSFPVIVGRRPSAHGGPSGKENQPQNIIVSIYR